MFIIFLIYGKRQGVLGYEEMGLETCQESNLGKTWTRSYSR